MRQKFDSYDDYRQVVDELESRLTKIIDEHKWEQLERELLKIIAWADKNHRIGCQEIQKSYAI